MINRSSEAGVDTIIHTRARRGLNYFWSDCFMPRDASCADRLRFCIYYYCSSERKASATR